MQAVYLGLAILLGGGLVLFGVGAGNGIGGILNAFTGNGSGGAQGQAVSAAGEGRAEGHPAEPQQRRRVGRARVRRAGPRPPRNSANYNSNTGQFTAAGKKELAALGHGLAALPGADQAPDANTAILAARAYAKLGNYSNAAGAWETVAAANPNEASAFECLAVNSYAASDTRKGDLAAAKAESLLPKANRTTIKQTFTQAKAQKSTAQGIAQQC